ncbi:MAG: 50S ribosomal protein L10 [bacterium]
MPKTRSKKEELVKEYREKFADQKSVVVANFSGLTVKEVNDLRKKCREQGISYMVAKKSLFNLALTEKGFEKNADLQDNIGVAFCKDEIGAAKVFNEYSKEHADKFNIVCGILESKMLLTEEIKALANLPSKEELLAKMVGAIKAPVNNFVNVLQGNLRGLVQVLNSIKDNKPPIA